MTADRVYRVLFLCTHNSARSVLSEAIMNRLGEGRILGFSAGSAPRGRVHPMSLRTLEELGYDTGGLRSKSWDEFAAEGAPPIDFVVTVCDNAANEVCPVWPGRPATAHWGVADPSRTEGGEEAMARAFRRTYEQLRQRLSAFAALPLERLEGAALTAALDEIGRMPAPAA